jgi:cell wall assembly regulator SMI1
MINIELTERLFKINNIDFSFPIGIQSLKSCLGDCRSVKTQHNTIYIWDDFGFLAYSKNGQLIESLMLNLQAKNYSFSPKRLFSGKIRFDDQEAIAYYIGNKSKSIKLFRTDSARALVLNNVAFWFDVNEGIIEAIEIQAYNPPAQHEPQAIDPEFIHLQTLWTEWVAQTNKIVTSNNKYYNLTAGISAQDIRNFTQLAEFEMPNALINFYKIHNVEYNGVTSAFSFSINNWEYDLLPFDKIRTDWHSIQNLADEEVEPEFRNYSDKINASTYANSAWIPIAEGRNGDYLLYDTDPSEKGNFGQIIELQNDTWARSVVADSLEQLIKNQIDLIKSGNSNFEFIIKNREDED